MRNFNTNQKACCISVTHYTPDILSRCSSWGGNDGPPIISQEETGTHISHGTRAQYNHLSFNGDVSYSNTSLSASEFSSASSLSLQDLDTCRTFSPTSGHTFSFDQSHYARNPRNNSFANTCFNYESSVNSWETLGPGVVGQERAVTPTQQAHSYPSIYLPQRPAKSGLRQQHDYATGHHNIVDIERISQGLDVRTTVRIRN